MDDGRFKTSAIKLAQQGFSVFKLPPGKKDPPPKAFFDAAVSDPTLVETLWTDAEGWPELNNIGVSTGNGLIVIDVDVKDGAGGVASFEELTDAGLDDTTFTVRTPSGGLHLYYRAPSHWPEIANSAGRLGPGIDVRGYHGYVVGPGSETGLGRYEVIRDNQGMLELPEWMLGLLTPKRERAENAGEWLVEPDLEHNVAQAASLAAQWPVPPEGTRNKSMAMFALDMRDLGISVDTAIDTGLEHWRLLADTSLHDEFVKTVNSAYGSAGLPAGRLTVDATLEDLSDQLSPDAVEPPPAASPARVRKLKSKFKLETMEDLEAVNPPLWLIGDWIQEGKVGLLYGKWGSFKSFIGMDIALHLAYGKQEWHSFATPGVPCEVLVIAAEGASGFRDRMRAWRKLYGITEMSPHLTFMRESVNFMDAAEFQALTDVLAESKRQFRLIIVDTVTRTLPGADSNTQETVSAFMDKCRRLGSVTGAAVLGVHHENKSGGMLGSTVFEGDSDFLFNVYRKNDTDLEGQVHCAKQKEGKDKWTRNFTLIDATTLSDDGTELRSLVVNNVGTDNVETTRPDATKLKQRRASNPTGPMVPVEGAKAFLDAMHAAWEAKEPLSVANNVPTKRNVYAVATHKMQLARNQAKNLLQQWELDGRIALERLRDGGRDMRGYRVLDGDFESGE